jgi:hypothetical protein
MKFHSFFSVAWPSMLGACLLEMLVFAVIDPQQVPVVESNLGLSAQGVYTIAFFAFWLAIGIACTMTMQLTKSPTPDTQA